MRSQIVRLANYAHTIVSPFGRRALLALAVFALVLYELVKWIGICIFIPAYPFICALLGFFKGAFEVPGYTIYQAKYNIDTWRIDAAGVGRIWRHFKPGDDK